MVRAKRSDLRMIKAFGFHLMFLTLLTMEKGWPVVSGHRQYDSALRLNGMYKLRGAGVMKSSCVLGESIATQDSMHASLRKRSCSPCLHLRGGSTDAHASMDEANRQLLKQTFSNWKDLMKSLMSSENEVRKDAEKKYDEIKAEMPDATCTALIQEITQGDNEESKTMAAVLARSSLSEVWDKLSSTTKEDIQSKLLDSLKAESSPNFLRKVANVVGAISFTANDGNWPQLLPTLYEMCKHDDSTRKELGFYILSLVLGHVGNELMKFDEDLQPLFENALQDHSAGVQVSGLKAISSFLSSCSSNKQMKPAQVLLSKMLAAIGSALQGDEHNARAGLDVLIEIAQINPRFFKPQLKEISSAMLQHVTMNRNLEPATRRLALEFLIELAEKAPAMIKSSENLVRDIVAVSLALMVEGLDTGVDLERWNRWEDEDDVDDEQQGNFEQGLEALDRLAVAIGGARMVPAAFAFIPDFIKNVDWRYRMAALYCISQIGEGCYKVMKKHLSEVVGLILPLLRDEHVRVRWVAINCIGQLSTDLGPAIQKQFHEVILPALIRAMDTTQEPSMRVSVHSSAATINFCEHASEELLTPYLPQLLQRLAHLLQQPHKQANEQAITTVAAIAIAVGEHFIPYYQEFMPFLKSLLAKSAGDTSLAKIRGKTMECISLIGVAVGAERFREDAKETMQLLFTTQEQELPPDDPQLSYLHQACGRICRVLKSEFVPYLPAILPSLLRSVGIKPDVRVEDGENADNEDLEGMEVVQVGDNLISIKTSALEEKANACQMLVTYLEQLEDGFFPYLEQVGREMKPLLTFWYHDDVRASAIQSMPAMVQAAVKYQEKHKADRSIVTQVLGFAFPALLQSLLVEPEVPLAAQTCRAIADCVKACGRNCLYADQLAEVAKALKQLLEDSNERMENVQGETSEEEDDDDEDQEEREAIAAETEMIDEVIYLVGKLIETHENGFFPYLEELLPWFLDKLGDHSHMAFKRLGMAMIDDVAELSGSFAERYVGTFMPLMLRHASSLDDELRQAALYGIGVCALNGGASFSSFTAKAVATLLHVAREEGARSYEKESATDNAVASLGKIAQHQYVEKPEELWSFWLSYLPLKGDVAESLLVNKQLCQLVLSNHAWVLGRDHCNLGRILLIFSQILETEYVDDEVTERIREILLHLNQAAPDRMQVFCQGVPRAGLEKLQRCMETTGAASKKGETKSL